jgi:hypothetical protein
MVRQLSILGKKIAKFLELLDSIFLYLIFKEQKHIMAKQSQVVNIPEKVIFKTFWGYLQIPAAYFS